VTTAPFGPPHQTPQGEDGLLREIGGYEDSTRGDPSTKRMRAWDGSMDRNSWESVSRAISARAPANSTPVGPPPTTTNVSRERILLCQLPLGRSNAMRMRAGSRWHPRWSSGGGQATPLVLAEVVMAASQRPPPEYRRRDHRRTGSLVGRADPGPSLPEQHPSVP